MPREECEHNYSEQRDEENLPERARDELDDSWQTAALGGVQSEPGRPECERNGRGGDTNAPC